MPAQDLLRLRAEPESHERAVVGRVGLVDADERDAGRREARGLSVERKLVGYGQNDRVGPLSEVSRR